MTYSFNIHTEFMAPVIEAMSDHLVKVDFHATQAGEDDGSLIGIVIGVTGVGSDLMVLKRLDRIDPEDTGVSYIDLDAIDCITHVGMPQGLVLDGDTPERGFSLKILDLLQDAEVPGSDAHLVQEGLEEASTGDPCSHFVEGEAGVGVEVDPRTGRCVVCGQIPSLPGPPALTATRYRVVLTSAGPDGAQNRYLQRTRRTPRAGRGDDGEPRWSWTPEDALEWATREAAQRAADECGGHVEEFAKPVNMDGMPLSVHPEPQPLIEVLAPIERQEVYTVQQWEESEAGWGVRPDGWSLHLNPDDRNAYIKAYWDSMPRGVPPDYERPRGDYYIVPGSALSDGQVEAVHRSPHGVRYYDRNYPHKP